MEKITGGVYVASPQQTTFISITGLCQEKRQANCLLEWEAPPFAKETGGLFELMQPVHYPPASAFIGPSTKQPTMDIHPLGVF